jgi:hypothetical protein
MEHCMVDGCHATCADLAALRHHERTAHGAVGDDWLPTAENVNALPDPLRRYIHDLETRADPSGDLRDKAIAQDEVAMLRAALNANVLKLGTALKALREIASGADAEGLRSDFPRGIAQDALNELEPK